MLFKKEDLINLAFGEETPLVLIEEGEWEDNGLYSYKDFIFEHDARFYIISLGRSGSFSIKYNYDAYFWKSEVECKEVVKKATTTYTWV